jgi:hypothetical protein
MSDYPEHDKLTKISGMSQEIGNFLEWLKGGYDNSPEHMTVCDLKEVRGGHVYEPDTYSDGMLKYFPTYATTQELLARYFDIDQKKIDAEKLAMLDAMTAKH